MSGGSLAGPPSARAATLVLAWGNPGRLDDGLGPALADRLSAAALPGVRVETDYHLQPEHAAEIAEYERVIFVDADRGGASWSLAPLEPSAARPRFTSHGLDPSAVLALAIELGGRRPEAWLLGIRGYEFDDFGERLSPGAIDNLERAESRLRAALLGGPTAWAAFTARPRAGHDSEEVLA